MTVVMKTNTETNTIVAPEYRSKAYEMKRPEKQQVVPIIMERRNMWFDRLVSWYAVAAGLIIKAKTNKPPIGRRETAMVEPVRNSAM